MKKKSYEYILMALGFLPLLATFSFLGALAVIKVAAGDCGVARGEGISAYSRTGGCKGSEIANWLANSSVGEISFYVGIFILVITILLVLAYREISGGNN